MKTVIGLEIQPSSCTIELHLYVVMQVKMPYYISMVSLKALKAGSYLTLGKCTLDNNGPAFSLSPPCPKLLYFLHP